MQKPLKPPQPLEEVVLSPHESKCLLGCNRKLVVVLLAGCDVVGACSDNLEALEDWSDLVLQSSYATTFPFADSPLLVTGNRPVLPAACLRLLRHSLFVTCFKIRDTTQAAPAASLHEFGVMIRDLH